MLFWTFPAGRLEMDNVKLRGEVEDLKARVLREQAERTDAIRFRDAQIQVLASELESLRLNRIGGGGVGGSGRSNSSSLLFSQSLSTLPRYQFNNPLLTHQEEEKEDGAEKRKSFAISQSQTSAPTLQHRLGKVGLKQAATSSRYGNQPHQSKTEESRRLGNTVTRPVSKSH